MKRASKEQASKAYAALDDLTKNVPGLTNATGLTMGNQQLLDTVFNFIAAAQKALPSQKAIDADAERKRGKKRAKVAK